MSRPAVDKVADRLHSAAIHLLRQLRRTDDLSGLSPARLSVLSVLVFAGEKTLGDLARIEQVRPPTMTRLVQGLEADGMVRRTSHTPDKRVFRIQASAKGRRILLGAQQRRLQQLSEMIGQLEPDEIRTLASAAELMERLGGK